MVIDALDVAFEISGKPKHIITVQGSVFTSAAFRDYFNSNNVKLHYGAIGEHGSIAVTERVIKTGGVRPLASLAPFFPLKMALFLAVDHS